MKDRNEFIESIIVKIGQIADSTGVLRVMYMAEVIQMLTVLKDGLNKEEKNHEEEKEILRAQLEMFTTLKPGEEEEVATIGSVEEMIENGNTDNHAE